MRKTKTPSPMHPRVSNPLNMFPSKSETLNSMFLKIDDANSPSRHQRNRHWLSTDHLDPNFGVSGQSREDFVKKSLRRVESSKLFVSPKVSASSFNLRDGLNTSSSQSRQTSNFVVVEESRLKELIKLEKILQAEKRNIGIECKWLMLEQNLSSRFALPALKYAVDDVCEGQMKNLRHKMIELNKNWAEYCKKQEYVKLRLEHKKSYIHKLPNPQRLHMLIQLREENQLWNINHERDKMEFEDDLSNFNNQYHNAVEIRTDYTLYYHLANKYGIFTEDLYCSAPLPGKRYMQLIQKSALKIQNVWRCYWPMMKLKRHKRCRKIQRVWRGHRSYQKYHPILSFQHRILLRDFYQNSWKKWKQYIRIVKHLNKIRKFNGATWLPRCFKFWKRYTQNLDDWRGQKITECLQKIDLRVMKTSVKYWLEFDDRCKYLKLFYRRAINGPFFKKWISYRIYSKHVKLLNRMAIKIQAHIRGHLIHEQYLEKKKAVEKISYFGMIVLAKKRRAEMEKKTIQKEFEEWIPKELQRQMNRNNEREKKRYLRQNKYLTDMEKKALEELKKHLSSRDGKLQLKDIIAKQDMAQAIEALGNAPSGAKPTPVSRSKENLKLAMQEVADRLLKECSDFCRTLHKHDFNVRNPLAFQCADVNCRAVFSTEIQYHNHMMSSQRHAGLPPQYSAFHIMLRTKKGQDALRRFLLRVEGIGSVANSLDLWVSIEEWSKVLSSSDQYISKALFIYENFLREDCHRPVQVVCEGLDRIIKKINVVKHREFEGFYKLHRAQPTQLRNIFGFDGEQFEQWTTENIIPGDMFEDLEWQSFLYLFYKLEELQFNASEEYAGYIDSIKEIEQREKEELFKEYLEYREREMTHWIEDFKFADQQRGNFAASVIEIYLEVAVEDAMNSLVARVGREVAFVKTQREQREKEPFNMILSDTLFWLEDNVSEFLFNFYSDILIKTMFEKDEFRAILYKFAGISEPTNVLKNRLANEDFIVDPDYWFDKFAESAIHEEKTKQPLEPEKAAVRIQRLIRGMQGRKKARRVFVTVYCKRYDETYSAFYYSNLVTGESSWERPRITQYLLPFSTW